MPGRDNRALAWMRAVRNSDLPSTTKLVLLTLGTRMDPNGDNCFPSTRTLADDTGLSRRSVEKHLREADARGWIERQERGRDENVRWRSLQYFPSTPTLGKEVPQDPGEGDSPSGADLGESDDETLGKQLPHTSTSTSSGTNGGDPGEGDSPSPDMPPPSELPKDESGRYEYPEPFEQAWSAYPDRDGGNPKKAAYRSWRARVMDGADPDELEEAAGQYADHIQTSGTERRFVKMARTFFGPDEWWREDWSTSSDDHVDSRAAPYTQGRL